MKCLFCGEQVDESVTSCPNCGKKISEIIKDQVKQELSASQSELNNPSPPAISPKSLQSDDSLNNTEKFATGDLSYDTGDPRKIEYKKDLKRVLADGRITAEEVVFLAGRVKELGLDKNEALNLQLDVAKELGLSLDEEGDLGFGGIVLEIDTNKGYIANEMGNFEFKITNISDENFNRASLSSYLMNQEIKKEKTLGLIKANQKKTTFLPFSPARTGSEIVEVCFEYNDPEGNPSVYKSEFQVRVLSRDEESRGAKSISISFNAEKIMGNDFSNMAKILEREKQPFPEKFSSYEESASQWRRLPVFFDEEETSQRRNRILITRKFAEGEEKLYQGSKLITEAEKPGKGPALDVFKAAYEFLRESKECFKKIRELDPFHEESFTRITEIRRTISDIETKIGGLEKQAAPPPVEVSSGCISMPDTGKRIYIYSKDRITLGRDSQNDLVLRLIPYQPKEKYLENYQKTSQISGRHAELFNRGGQFYLRDIGSDGSGSLNGTFLDGKRLKGREEYLLKDNVRINIAKVLDLECNFLGNFPRKGPTVDNPSFCYTVMGDITESCFGVDKQGFLNAIKIRRRNNYTDEEEYIILVREITIGRSRTNGIAIDDPKVSDIHARIFFRESQYWIEDLNSRQGTLVNSVRISPGEEISLGAQSDILIGSVPLRFQGI